jgi:hypothetical protein
VISPQDRYTVAVAQLHCDEEGDRLDRVVAPVYIISHKEIVGVRGVSANTEKL